MLTCAYCGRNWSERNGACEHCGAPNKLSKIEKFDPFFCEGYIVYGIRDYCRDCFTWVFYKGITLIGKVEITGRELSTYSPAIDIMPVVMERLRVTAGASG